MCLKKTLSIAYPLEDFRWKPPSDQSWHHQVMKGNWCCYLWEKANSLSTVGRNAEQCPCYEKQHRGASKAAEIRGLDRCLHG